MLKSTSSMKSWSLPLSFKKEGLVLREDTSFTFSIYKYIYIYIYVYINAYAGLMLSVFLAALAKLENID